VVRQGMPTRGRSGVLPDVMVGGIGTPNPNIRPEARQPGLRDPTQIGLAAVNRMVVLATLP